MGGGKKGQEQNSISKYSTILHQRLKDQGEFVLNLTT